MSEEALIRRRIETRAVAGRELEAIKRRELKAMTDGQVREAVEDLLTIPLPPDLSPRVESGLVEQQRWFSKLRTKA